MNDDSIRYTENAFAMMNEIRPTESRTTFTNVQDEENELDVTALEPDDLELFEEAILESILRVEVPIMTLRQQNEKEDPQEEIVEVLQEAADIESKLKKLIDCSQFMFEKTKGISHKNKQLVKQLEDKQQQAIKAENGKRVVQDQLRERTMTVLIEQEKLRDLKVSYSNLEEQLVQQQQINQEFESQLKKEIKGISLQSSQDNDSFNQIKAAEVAMRDKFEDLQRQFRKEKEKCEELEELAAKNLMLYEHEAKKTDTLHKEWTKEKSNAMQFKKRYTRSKELNDKRSKIQKELEATIKDLNDKLRVQERQQQEFEQKKVKETNQLNLSVNQSMLNMTQDQDTSRASLTSLNASVTQSYVFGKGRDSVVSKSIRMSKEGGLQSGKLLQTRKNLMQSIDFSSKVQSLEPEPLVLTFPYPVTRKIDMDNYQKKSKLQRRASIELISALKPDLIDSVKNPEIVESLVDKFMFGRNGAPSQWYINKESGNFYMESDLKKPTKAKLDADFDEGQFACMVKSLRQKRRSTSVQFKTAYKDDVPLPGIKIKVPARRAPPDQFVIDNSVSISPGRIRDYDSFVGLDQNNSYMPKQTTDFTYNEVDDSRIEGDILPDMFQDEYQQMQMRESQVNNEYMQFDQDRMTQMQEMQGSFYNRVGGGETNYSKRSIIQQPDGEIGTHQINDDIVNDEEDFDFQRQKVDSDVQHMEKLFLFKDVSNVNFDQNKPQQQPGQNALLTTTDFMIQEDTETQLRNTFLKDQMMSASFVAISEQIIKNTPEKIDTAHKATESKLETDEVKIPLSKTQSVLEKIESEVLKLAGNTKVNTQDPIVVDDVDETPTVQEYVKEDSFDAGKDNLNFGKAFKFEDDDNIEFDNGVSPNRDQLSPGISESLSPGQFRDSPESRRSFVPFQIDDNDHQLKLEKLYQDLSASVLQEMQEDLDQQKTEEEENEIRKQNILRQNKAKKLMEIQVIEEEDNEEASVNPYGIGISPNAMAGDKYLGLGQSLRKLKAKQLNTPQAGQSGRMFGTPLASSQVSLGQSMRVPGQKMKIEFEIDEGSTFTRDQLMRKDPHEEFFKLTLLAFKLNNKVSQNVLMTDPQETYSQCQKTKLAFYKWPQWIEDFMKRMMFRERNTNNQVARTLWLMDMKREQETVLGEDYHLKQKHF